MNNENMDNEVYLSYKEILNQLSYKFPNIEKHILVEHIYDFMERGKLFWWKERW